MFIPGPYFAERVGMLRWPEGPHAGMHALLSLEMSMALKQRCSCHTDPFLAPAHDSLWLNWDLCGAGHFRA